MLQIKVPATEQWDEHNECFVNTKEQILQLEHSLVSLSKWESKWKKPFISKDSRTLEETIDYVRCMTLTQNVDPNVFHCLTNENLREIYRYIDDPMTATTFSKVNSKPNRDVITSEIIYWEMIELGIPMECQKWHLNRLLTLIKVCDVKNQSPKKQEMKDIMKNNTALNAARRQKLHSKG